MVLVCPELSTVFPDVHDLSQRLEHFAGDARAVCPSCHKVKITDFQNSTSDELRALDLTEEDYT